MHANNETQAKTESLCMSTGLQYWVTVAVTDFIWFIKDLMFITVIDALVQQSRN